MGADDGYPAEMPNHPSSPIPALDRDTAERLLSGRLDPDDAPPAYAGVARLLQAAAAPPHPDELAGQSEALALFHAARVGPAGVGGRRSGVGGRRSGTVRGRLVAVALAGVLVVGGAVAGVAATGGLWTNGGAPSSGGAGAGAAGSGAPGIGPGSVAGSGGPGLLRPAGAGAVMERERAVARHRGGGGSRRGGTAHGTKPVRTPEAKASKAKPGKPEAHKPTPKGPKTTPSHGANHSGGKRK